MTGAIGEREAGVTRFELGFVDGGGVEQRAALAASAHVRFEDTPPVRRFRWSRRSGHFPGWWWSASTDGHVGYESWLERDHVMLMDFDPEITAFASQPFWLYWDGCRGERRHAPDFFARRADGTGVVVDVRADDRVEPGDAEAFEAAATACAQVGWEFRRVGVVDPVLAANVRWLSRYRHPRYAGSSRVEAVLLGAFTEPAPLWAGAAGVGDTLAVLPVLFHLMWRGELAADLVGARLGPSVLVRRGTGGAGGR
jgi:hypothetical protein